MYVCTCTYKMFTKIWHPPKLSVYVSYHELQRRMFICRQAVSRMGSPAGSYTAAGGKHMKVIHQLACICSNVADDNKATGDGVSANGVFC